MVERRDGDEIDLLDSSIRTAGGALVSTPLFAVSGLVYAVVTSPAATGTYFFVTLVAGLVLRPVRGVGQTLQKVGSEPGESVAPYLGLTLLFALGYLAVAAAVAALLANLVVRRTVVTAGLLGPLGLYALGAALSTVATGLLGAVGHPGVQTWVAAGKSAVRLVVLLALAPALSGAADLLVVAAAVSLVFVVPVVVAAGVVPAVPDRHALARTWAFARWSVPDQVFDRLSYNMPVYVLGVVATPAAVGVYEAADRIADFGATVAWRLSSPLLTVVSGDAAAGDETFAYLDGAVTGGTGVTVLVLGYLLAAHDVVATVAFPGARAAFSTTVLVVGGVNVFRGFWTLATHAVEGLGHPGLSFRTKLYGLVAGVPVTATFGAEFGAVAGAAGYAAMNLVVFAAVVAVVRRLVGRVPVAPTTAVHLALGLVVSFAAASGAIAALGRLGLSPTPVAAGAAVVSLLAFAAALAVVSAPFRRGAARAVALCRARGATLAG